MIEIHPVTGIGEVAKNADLPKILSNALAPIGVKTGDILVVTQKIVSKAEGRMIALSSVSPSLRAHELATATGKDPRLVELILSESTDIIRAQRGVMITRHRIGLVMANAGIDCSNLGPGQSDSALLLPLDPDASAAMIANNIECTIGMRPAVLISDSFGRPWRHGVVNVAIGCAGLPALYDKRGQTDRNGRVMQATLIAYGDLIASAAGLAMGEADEGVPAVVVRGLSLPTSYCNASTLIRARDEDMFL